MKNFIMFIGLPGAGKSTIRNIICEKNPDIVVISTDDCLEKEGKEKGLKYNQAFNNVEIQDFCKTYTTNLFQDSIKSRKDILVDRTNLTKKSRKRLISQLPKEYKKHFVYFDIPRCFINHNIFERFLATGKTIPSSVIDDMESWLQFPLTEEYDTLSIIDEDCIIDGGFPWDKE